MDGGATWTVGKLQDRSELVNVEFANEEMVIGVGYSGVAMSGHA